MAPNIFRGRRYPGYLRREKIRSGRRRLFFGLVLSLLISTLVSSEEAMRYTVKTDDTLYSIARKYGVSVEQVRLANGVNANFSIRPGDTLAIPLQYHVVSMGETLSSVALKIGVSEDKLRQLNRLTGDAISAGMRLVTPQKPVPGQTYTVSPKDTLSYVSMRFDVDQDKLIKYNNLPTPPALRVGQVLRLTPAPPENYVVRTGDTLYGLARKHNMDVDRLMQYNALNGDTIKPGDELVMYGDDSGMDEDIWTPGRRVAQKPVPAPVAPPVVAVQPDRPSVSPATPTWKPAQNSPKNDSSTQYAAFNPPVMYFNDAPNAGKQPNDAYAELSKFDFRSDYKAAKALIDRFDKELAALAPLGSALKGYSVAIDPGHGGYDPGALMTYKHNGQTMTIVEAQYNYDIALRLYALLKRNGARATMTILAPNHTTLNNSEDRTLVNQKNGVYNDPDVAMRPIGGMQGLKERVKIGKAFFARVPKSKRVWISVHADSGPTKGLVALAVNPSAESVSLANHVIKKMGRGRAVSGNYVALTNNPAPAAVLVEVRNPSQGEGPVLNNFKARQEDAQKLCDAIISYVKSGK